VVTPSTKIDFDHHSLNYREHGPDILRNLRHECPVSYSENHGGMWVVLDYQHVAQVIKDPGTFSSTLIPGTKFQGVTIPRDPTHPRAIPIELDPPEYTPYRRLLNPWFSPAAVERLAPTIRRVTDAILDEVIESGEIDLVRQLADPVPGIMTMHLLGLSLEEWDTWARPDGQTIGDAEVSHTGTATRMLEAIVDRRSVPKENDLLTFMTEMEIDGKKLSDEGVLEIAMLVLAGGVDTTTSLIAHALLYLHRDREARQRLIQQPELRRPACEEFLRHIAPVQTQARTVTRDTDLGGCPLQAGDRVLVSWAGANRDEEVFERPDDVILDRHPNRHLAFGMGIHRCIGSNFARAEFLAMLDAVLTRMPDYEVVEDQVQPYSSIGMINGLLTMPATFTPGPRIGEPLFKRGSAT
jgi:cytochrome P450